MVYEYTVMEKPVLGQREHHQHQAESVFQFLKLLITQSFQVQYLLTIKKLIQQETEKKLFDVYFCTFLEVFFLCFLYALLFSTTGPVQELDNSFGF